MVEKNGNGRKKILVSDVEPLIEQLQGNIAAIARALRVSRHTVYARIRESPTLAQAIEDARETHIDNIYSALYSQAIGGNTTALIFLAKTLGKHRGFTERLEVSGPDGNPLEVKGYVSFSPSEWDEEPKPEDSI